MTRKLISYGVALWAGLAAAHGATTLSSATSDSMMIDTRAHKAVLTFGRYWPTQAVRYSGYAWDTRFASKTAEVTVDGVTLVKAADEGQVAWRPARVGLHTLHHTVLGGTLTRTYYAEGPTVRSVCTQTGTAGSMLCQIDCDMPGATIYYTTDGTEPTTASRVYTGPFQLTLPKIKRLLAVAVVDGYPMSQTAYPIISIIEDVSVASSATSDKMVVDTRAGKGPIETDHAEDITYSNLWSGDADATATVAVNGEVVKSTAGEGDYHWPLPSKGGNYVFTHTTTKDGAQVGETLTATFVVASHEIEIDDGTGGAGGKDSRFSYSGMYDGQGHGISVEVTSVAEPHIQYALVQEGPYSDSLLLTNACRETAVWYTVSAAGYNTYTNWATVTITPRSVTLTSGSASKVYDGIPLTVGTVTVGDDGFVDGEGATYAFTGAQSAVGTSANTFAYSLNDGTKAGNYTITTAYGTLTVTKATVGGGTGNEPGEGTIPAGGLSKFDATDVYDGEGHTIDTNAVVAAFAARLGAEAFAVTYAINGTAEEEPGQPVLPWAESPMAYTNAGEYVVWYRVTSANYEDFVHAAKLTVTRRPVTVVVAGHTATNTYDAFEHAVTGYDIAAEDEFYDIAADTTFTGAATATRTDVGTTPMGLTAADFTNGNGNFAVTYAVTDGGQTIAAADITAGEADDFVLTLGANPTYNGTVQTIPVTAVTYRGLPVTYMLAGENATHAGTYTLTVRANGNFTGERSTTWQILKRKVTLTSGSSTRVYTGEALVNGAVTVGGDGFIGVEGAMFTVTGSQTAAGMSKNAFAYALKAGTLAGDYEITKIEGDLVVTKRPVTLVSASASKAYDATPLRRDVVTVKPGTSGFADGEGFTATCSGTITAVGSTANAFSYTLAPNTQASNYTISTEYGTLTVTKGTLDPSEVLGEGGAGTDEQPRLCARVYNGEAQGLLVEPNLREPYTILYALAPPDFGATSPTRTNVADGDLKIHFRLVTDNYDPLDGVAILRIVPKMVTDEMLAYSNDAFFFDGADTKVPDVILVDTNALGVVISTAKDYTRMYGERLATGEYPVTITGANNYTGTVTKAFAVLKRPVAPPVITAKSYKGSTQKPTIPSDKRWMVVANPGGVNAGFYTNVVLRLTNTEDYRWKPLGEDETDWTGVFEIKKAANGWSTYPGIKSWTNGVEAASEPVGRARYGTVSVAYRRAGTDIATETSVKPTMPGKYIARFWVEPTDNYAGYALTVHYEVAFEIFAGPDDPAGGDATTTTPVPVPHAWLDKYVAAFGQGDRETAAHAIGRNGVALWASYVAGLDPENPESRLRAQIAIGADGSPVVTWEPDLSRDTPSRTYTIYGKDELDAKSEWVPVTDANKSRMRFFKVVVDL